MGAHTIIIDDTDPQVVYTGFWERGGVGQEYQYTTHGTSTAGSRATFKFNGSSIAVYGTIGRENNNGDPSFAPVTAYSVDGSARSSFTGRPRAGVVYRQLFYQSPQLEEEEEKEHTLVIENTLAGRNMFWFDYLQLVSSTERPVTTPILSPSPPVGGPHAPGVVWPDVFAGVVLGSIGTLVSLVLVCCALVLCVRRRARGRGEADMDDELAASRSGSRSRTQRPAGRTAFDDQYEAQLALLGDDDYAHADVRTSTYPGRDDHGFQHSVFQPKSVPPGVFPNKPPKVGNAASPAGIDRAQEDSPPAYNS